MGVYVYPYDIASLNAAKTVLYLQAPTGYSIELISAWLTNRSVTVAEQLQVGVFKVAAAGIGTPAGADLAASYEKIVDGGTGDSPILIALGALTAEPTSYNTSPCDKQGASNVAGYFYYPDAVERPIVAAGNGIGLRLLANPSNAFAATAMMKVRVRAA